MTISLISIVGNQYSDNMQQPITFALRNPTNPAQQVLQELTPVSFVCMYT
jgi:hypothetical protein